MFRIDGSFYRILCKITDLMILNMLWLIGCVPVVTAGASTAALYHCCIKCVRRDRSRPGREFWRAYRQNLRAGIVGTILLAAVAYLAVLYISFSQSLSQGGFAGTAFRVVLAAYLIVNAVTFSALFPTLSRFDLKFRKLLELAFFMGMGHPFRSGAALLVLAGAVLLTLGSPLFLLLLPAPAALLCTFLYEPILLRHMPKEQAPGVDAWYLESRDGFKKS